MRESRRYLEHGQRKTAFFHFPAFPSFSSASRARSDEHDRQATVKFGVVLLIATAIGFLSSCGESKPPAAPASPVAVEPLPPAVDSGQLPADLSPETAAPAPAEPPNLAGRKLAPEQIRNGEDIYRRNCASCHGPNGEARPDWRIPGADGRYPPPPLDGSAHAWHHSTETLEKMILEGSQDGAMPAWEGKLTKQQVDDVIVWIKSLWPDEVYDIWLKEIEHGSTPG